MVGGVARGVACAGVVCLAAFLSPLARACDLPPPETAKVAAVIDGETLKLADGRTVKLIGAKAPNPPLGWRGEDPWPFVEDARGALESLAANKAIEVGSAGAAQTGTAIFSPRSSSLRGKAGCGSRTSSSAGDWRGSIRFPTTGPAPQNFSRAKKKRGRGGSGFGPRRSIASRTRST
jgi:hypothetical protein